MRNDSESLILDSVRYEKLFNIRQNPFGTTCVINTKLINSNNIDTLINEINTMTADETRPIFTYIILYSSNTYTEYSNHKTLPQDVAFPSHFKSKNNIDDFIKDFTEELEKKDLERYMLLLNPIN